MPKEKTWNKKIGRLTFFLLLELIVISSLGGCSNYTNLSYTQQTTQEVSVVFDLEALYGKNINEIRGILGEPTDGEYTNPTAQQLALGTKEWSNSFKKDTYELLVTYDVDSKKVIDFFISTDDPSGATKDTKTLEKILNVENSKFFTIEPVKNLKDPSVYTGIKVLPKNS